MKTRFSPEPADLPLLILGGTLTLLFLLIGALPRPLVSDPNFYAYVPAFLAAFGFYGFAVYRLLKHGGTRNSLVILLGFALLFRLITLFQPPTLSTDIWRYVWDGHIGAQGINPYRYAPSDPAVIPYHTGYWNIINHPTWVTMYPPLSQRIFTLIGLMGGSTPLTYKVVFLAFDLGTMGLILLLLKRLKLPLEQVVIYAWHPLVMMELIVNGHQDILGIFFMVAAVAVINRTGKPRDGLLGGLGAGLSLMGKGYLLPALPIFARRRPVQFVLAFGVIVAILMLPYMGAGSQIQSGMDKYLHNRLRNAGAFAAVAATVQFLLHYRLSMSWNFTRLFMMGALGLVVLAQMWQPWKDESDLMRRSTVAMGTFFILSHTIYPWYATWLLPGICLLKTHTERRAMFGWWVWSGLITLAYLNPVPLKNPWVLPLEYLPVWALLLWQGGFLPPRDDFRIAKDGGL